MNIVDDIKSKRRAQAVHCGYLPGAVSLTDVAIAFSLSPDVFNYRKVDKGAALDILTRLLHKDMAFSSEIMPVRLAGELSLSFLRAFDDESATFYTNIDYSLAGQKIARDCWAGPDSKPVTSATFDAGVIAISKTQSACLWIEDED